MPGRRAYGRNDRSADVEVDRGTEERGVCLKAIEPKVARAKGSKRKERSAGTLGWMWLVLATDRKRVRAQTWRSQDRWAGWRQAD